MSATTIIRTLASTSPQQLVNKAVEKRNPILDTIINFFHAFIPGGGNFLWFGKSIEQTRDEHRKKEIIAAGNDILEILNKLPNECNNLAKQKIVLHTNFNEGYQIKLVGTKLVLYTGYVYRLYVNGKLHFDIDKRPPYQLITFEDNDKFINFKKTLLISLAHLKYLQLIENARKKDDSLVIDVIEIMEKHESESEHAKWVINFSTEDTEDNKKFKFESTGNLKGGFAQDLYINKKFDHRYLFDQSAEETSKIMQTTYINNKLIGSEFTLEQKQLFHLARSKLWHMLKVLNIFAHDYHPTLDEIILDYNNSTMFINFLRNNTKLREYCFKKAEEELKKDSAAYKALSQEEISAVKKFFCSKDYIW